MERPSENTKIARLIGMLTFVTGVTLLAFVFFWAYALFSAPPAGVPGTNPTTGNLASAGMSLVTRIGLLCIMTLAGSLIAGRGVHMYLGHPQGKS